MKQIPQPTKVRYDALLAQRHIPFRHVMKNDFDDLKDIPRAKRKPYIPAVLSREEIDAIIARLKYLYDLIVKLLYGCASIKG